MCLLSKTCRNVLDGIKLQCLYFWGQIISPFLEGKIFNGLSPGHYCYHMYSWLTKCHVMYTNQEVEVYSLLLNLVLCAGGKLGGCHSLSTSSGEDS